MMTEATTCRTGVAITLHTLDTSPSVLLGSHPMATPSDSRDSAETVAVEPWQELRILVPAQWKRWLQEAASVRGLSVSALVRQCIRELMIERHRYRDRAADE